MEHWPQRTSIAAVFHWEQSNYFFHLISRLYRTDLESVRGKDSDSFDLRRHRLKLLDFEQVVTMYESNCFL